MTAYVTFTIVNNTGQNGGGLADAAIYLFVTQESINLAWQIDASTGIAAPMASSGRLPAAFTLADLKQAGGAIQFDASATIPSARIYLGSSPDTVTAEPASNPSISGPTAGTAQFYYDFVEFALNGTPNNLNIDTTQVDQLGIPITLQVVPNDPNYAAGSGVIGTLDRQTLFGSFSQMASGRLAAFADCVFPSPAAPAAPYRLLNPSDVISSQLNAAALQGTLASSGSAGAWQATFTITGPGTPAPTNGGLAVGMRVGGPFLPAGMTVASLPGTPSGQTVIMTSTATTNPFGSSSAPVTLYFYQPIATALTTWFDAAIDDFFAWCQVNPGWLQIEQNVGGANVVFTGTVTQITGTGIDGGSYGYCVLQFTVPANASAGTFNLYYPFFTSNAAAGKTTPFGSPVPPPPAFWISDPKSLLPITWPASLMVFGAGGVFADNTQQFPNDAASAATLGAIENVVVTGLARGCATAWQFKQGAIQPVSGNPRSANVTLATGSDTTGLATGMDMASFQIAQVPMTATLGQQPNSLTVTSPQSILPTLSDLLTFAQFYPSGGAWSAFANFLHDDGVMIGGRAYALPFDDQGGFSSDLSSTWLVGATPTAVTVTLGPWQPPA